MARYAPRSQTPALLAEKADIARRLLQQGLTVRQVSAQLRCSASFVRNIQVDDHGGRSEAAGVLTHDRGPDPR